MCVRPARRDERCKCRCLFFEAATGRGQVGGVNERGGVLPKRRRLDQGLEDRFVDLPQSHYAYASAKGIEDANIRGAMAMAQPSKIPPSALLGQQLGQQIERMHRGQKRQQMRAPELGRTELPMRAAQGMCAATLVDEVVGDVWIKQAEQLVGAGDRQAVHSSRGYPFGNVPSGFCFNSQFIARRTWRIVSYAETCNTLY